MWTTYPKMKTATRKSKPAKKKNLKQIAFTRFMLVVAFFIIWIGGISVRLVHLQVTQHDWLRERALDQRQDVKKSRLLRGTIYDRNGRALAMSVNVKTLYADPTQIVDLNTAAKDLSKALNINQKQIFTQLKNGKDAGKHYVVLAKKLDDDTFQKVNKTLQRGDVKKADLPKYEGLFWTDEQKRSYPNGTLAANVVGFSNADDIGQAGIEQSQNDILHGAVIKKLQERDRLGRVYDESVTDREPPKDIVLTIDNTIQYKVEQALERGVKNAAAKSGMAVVIDPKTGEVLAMANYPTFDPANYGNSKPETRVNKLIQNVYSPGSVFKLITYGSALEKHLITPFGQIDAGNGTIEVAKHRFSDHHTGVMTYAEALAHSSNVCAIKTGMRVGKTDFYSTVQKMGFGQKTGIELPAETAGIVRSPDRWNGDSLASMSIGYEIGVTALQMATAFATIANDGVKIQPHIIKEIRQADETVVSVTQPEKVQVVSPETARDLRTMLREVVLEGTGRRAQLDGYTSAGKTGTAWKFNPATKRVDPSKYVSSFIGMAPAEDPDVVIAVVMDEPQVGARDGGMVSAPVFKEIAEEVLPELNVNPDKSIAPQEMVAQDIPETASNGEGPGKELDITAAEQPRNAADAKNETETTPKATTKKTDVKKPAEVEKKKADAPKKVTGNNGKRASVKMQLRETRIKSSIEGTRLKT